MPRIRELILRFRAAQWPVVMLLSETVDVQAVELQPDDGLAGAAICFSKPPAQDSWRVIEMPSGALLQLTGDGNNATGLLHLPFNRYGEYSIAAFPATQTRACNWRQLVNASGWMDDLPSNWSGGAEDVSLTIEGDGSNRKLILIAGAARSRMTLTFGGAGAGDVLACLVSAEGRALSSWLQLQPGVDVGDAFGQKMNAAAIFGADGEQCGWLITLSEVHDEEGHAPADTGTASLLVTTAAQATCFSAGSDDSPALALSTRALSESPLSQHGWIHFPEGAQGAIYIESGPEIVLRSELATQGFALGPAPADIDGTISVFGVLVPRSQLVTPNGDARSFEPREYLPEPTAPPVAHPSDVIADIRKNQTRLATRVDGLLDRLGGMMASHSDTPEDAPALFFDLLDHSQQAIWNLVCTDEDGGEQPFRFSFIELRGRCQTAGIYPGEDGLAKTVELFIRLGLIVPVHVDGRNLYRRVLQSDIMAAQQDGQA